MTAEVVVAGGGGVVFCIGAYAYVYNWPRRIREHLLVRRLRREIDNHL